MKQGPNIAHVAALIGDPARANMLTALMSGKALTATELAHEAGITAQTASSHLGKLEASGLVIPSKQGRHKYYTLTSSDIATVLEGLMGLAAVTGHLRTRTGPKDKALRKARVCYNHLAGDMGTRMYDSLVDQGFLDNGGEHPDLTAKGAEFVTSLGIELAPLTRKRVPLCRQCLDWSERRSHLAGSLGRAILAKFVDDGWAQQETGSRVVRFTRSGEDKFNALFGNGQSS